MRGITSIFKALSEETRLQMLGLLMHQGELCVCDFMQVLDITQSKASRHLRHLVNAGLLDDRRETTWVYFRLADSPGRAQAEVLKMLPTVLNERISAQLLDQLESWLKQKERTAIACDGPAKKSPSKRRAKP